MTSDDAAAAEALNRRWDEVVRGGDLDPVHPGGLPGDRSRHVLTDGALANQEALARAIRRLHALDDAPPPAPAFAARLGRELGIDPAVIAPEAPTAPARVGHGRRLGLIEAGGWWPVAELAAVLVLAILGGRLLGDDIVPWSTGSSPTVAAAPGPTTTAAVPVDHERCMWDGPHPTVAPSGGATATAGATRAASQPTLRSPTLPADECAEWP